MDQLASGPNRCVNASPLGAVAGGARELARDRRVQARPGRRRPRHAARHGTRATVLHDRLLEGGGLRAGRAQ